MADNKLFEINPCPRCGLDKISIGLAKQIDDGEWLCELECRACFFSVWSTDEQIDQAVEQAKLKWTGNTLYSEQLDDLHLTLSRLVSDSQWARRIIDSNNAGFPDGTVQTLTTIAERAKTIRDIVEGLQERNQNYEKD